MLLKGTLMGSVFELMGAEGARDPVRCKRTPIREINLNVDRYY